MHQELESADLFQAGLPVDKISEHTQLPLDTIAEVVASYGYDAGKKLTVDEAQIVEAYRKAQIDNEPEFLLDSIARQAKVSIDVILRVLEKHRVERKDYFNYIPDAVVVDNYLVRKSLIHWARHYNVKTSAIRKILKRNNVQLATRSEANKRYFFNDSIFETIDTEEKAYWLGFMFADGSVSLDRDDVSIKLKNNDVAHVQKFCDFVGYERTLDTACITIRSHQMKRDLIRHGCLPRKSWIDVTPLEVPANMHRHFARGVCDGDGHVGVYRNSASIEIVGSRGLLTWLSENGLAGNVRPHSSIWRLRSKAGNVLDWARWLYKDSTVYLDRKYESYLKMEELFNDK